MGRWCILPQCDTVFTIIRRETGPWPEISDSHVSVQRLVMLFQRLLWALLRRSRTNRLICSYVAAHCCLFGGFEALCTHPFAVFPPPLTPPHMSKSDVSYHNSGRDVRNMFSLWWFVFEGIVTLWLIQIQENNSTATKTPHSQLSKSVQLSGWWGKICHILWSQNIQQALFFLHLLSFETVVTSCLNFPSPVNLGTMDM